MHYIRALTQPPLVVYLLSGAVRIQYVCIINLKGWNETLRVRICECLMHMCP
jgi:hypothetical protein